VWWYIGIAALVVTQGGWIGFLLLEQRRRTRLEAERERTAEALRESEAKNRAILNALPDLMFLLDERGTYLDWHADDSRKLYVPPEQFLGKTIREVLPLEVSLKAELACEQAMSSGKPARLEYSLEIDGQTRFCETRIIRCGDRRLLAIVRDITDLKRAEIELQQLSSQLMRLQDDERLRIARDLHNATAQHLFAITLSLENLKRLGAGISPEGVELLNECRDLCEQSLQEVRTLLYLRNPPELEGTSLVSALRWYVQGFRKRTGIAVDLQVAPDFVKLPIEMEVDLFRVVQERLFNLFRHSDCRSAAIVLENDEVHVFLQIKDSGYGGTYRFTPALVEPSSGVGMFSLHDRLHRWGGHLSIESDSEGGLLVAEIPIHALDQRGN
jgi:PAS domain S-box-containing protein